MRTVYDDRCTIHNTDRDRTIDVEILEFSPEKRLVVSVERSVKVNLPYDSNHRVYVGSMAGLEFTSLGPTAHTVNEGYRR